MKTTRLLVLAALVPLAAVTTPAALADQVRTRTVAIADLDLSTRADRNRLDRRIRRVIEGVCGNFLGTPIDRHEAVTRCRAEAAAQAKAQLGRRASLASRD